MNKFRQLGRKAQGFTLTELVTVMAVVGLLAVLALPALAHAKTKNSGVGCVNNMRQMMVAWAMYKEDNNDFIVPNNKGSGGWLNNVPNEDWQNSSGNTNASAYGASLLGTYLQGDVRCFSCPADNLPSDNGLRIKSRSMSGQMGISSTANDNPSYKSYAKGSDFTCPQPASLFIFADESFWSMNDGYLQLGLNNVTFMDTPAAYHAGGGGFSFADGHGEIHQWRGLYKYDSYGFSSIGIRGVPYIYNVKRTGTQVVPPANGKYDVDWIWLTQHSSCPAGQ